MVQWILNSKYGSKRYFTNTPILRISLTVFLTFRKGVSLKGLLSDDGRNSHGINFRLDMNFSDKHSFELSKNKEAESFLINSEDKD